MVDLTDLQEAAALADMVYRRGLHDQPVDIGINGTIPGSDFDLSKNPPSNLNLVDNFYYNDSTGFVGRVVQANGKVFVVFRGIDLGGELIDAVKAAITGGSTSQVDANDLTSASIPLGLGTISTTQFDDAVALTRAAMTAAAAQGRQVVVAGQSLGGGLAGLVSAALNLKSYIFNPAPLANDLPYVAAKLAWTDNGLPISALSANPHFENVLSALLSASDADLATALTSYFTNNFPQYLDKVQSIVASRRQYLDNIAKFPSNVTAERIEGEALTSGFLGIGLDIAASQFKVNFNLLDAGAGDSWVLHGEPLTSLIIRTEGSAQPFRTLLENDAALRAGFLDATGTDSNGKSTGPIAGPLNTARADPANSPSRMGPSGPSSAIVFDAMWKTVGDPAAFYSQFYTRFTSWLSTGAVAQGLSSKSNDPLSVHSAVVDLGLQVVRDAINRDPGSSTIISDAGLNVFGPSNGDGTVPRYPTDGYVRIDLADITATDERLKDPTTKKAYGVLNVTYAVANALVNQFPGSQFERQSLAGSILGGALRTDLLDQVKAGDIQLKPWSTLIVQAGSESGRDGNADPLKVDATALDLKSAVIFGGPGSTLAGSAGDNSLDETITGSKGNDVLVSGGANTTFMGSLGQDLIIGGAKNDTYIAQASSIAKDDTTFVGGAGSDTAVYGNGFDHVTFTLAPEDLAKHTPGTTPLSGADVDMSGDRVDRVINAQVIEFAGKTDANDKKKITASNNTVVVDPELEPAPNVRVPNANPNDIIVDGGGRDANNTLDLNKVTAAFDSAGEKFVFSGDKVAGSPGAPASGITYRNFADIEAGGGDPPDDTFILNTPEDSSIKNITLGDGNDTIEAFLQDGTDTLTMTVGNGNDVLVYSMPILTPADPNKQGFVVVNAGDGNDTIGGAGPGEINLGNGNDTVLPGFGSIVNASGDSKRGKDVIFAANDVQLNNLQPQDRIDLLGVTDLTGGVRWKGSEDPFAYGRVARYGLNTQHELVIQDLLGDQMLVADDHSGPGTSASQETAGIFIATVDLHSTFLLDPNLPQGWLQGQMSFVNALTKAYDGPTIAVYGGVDPLVFDLTGDGISLTDVSTVAPTFDMHGNGFAVQTGWIGPTNGLLVLDRNGDGQINDVSELFGGEATSGGVSAVGFAQLAKYDSNLDGVIDASDPIYSQVRIWRDSNGDGVTEPGELLTLQQAGIASIDLTPTLQSGDMSAGNQIVATGSFTRADGTTGRFADASFHTDNFDTTFTGDTSVSAAAAALPDLRGHGTLTALRVAMSHDPALADSTLGPSLTSVVSATVPTLTGLDLPTLRAEITPILTAWTKAVRGIDPNGNPLTITTQSHADVPILVTADSTGGTTVADFAYEVTDQFGSYWQMASGTKIKDSQGNTIQRPTLAQITSEPPAGSQWTTFAGAQLDFMERYTGDPVPLGTGAPVEPGAALQAAISTIQVMWQTLNQIAVALAMQGPLAPYFQGIVYDAATNKFEPTDPGQQLTPMYEAIFRAAPQDATGAASWLATWKPILDVVFGDFTRGQGLDVTYGYMFANMVTASETVGLPLDIADAAAALGVPKNEIVEGGPSTSAQKTLRSNGFDDIFYMSSGDQTAIGGNGVENFVLGGHFGDDVIIDDKGILSGQSPNILRLASTKSTDVIARRDGNDLILDVKGTNQEVTIVNEFIGVLPEFILANVDDAWGVTQIAFADGVVWDKINMAWAVEPNTDGVDGTLLGTSSSDVLNGGNGNHFLSGGDGGDIYLYDRGDGNDTIFVNDTDLFLNTPNVLDLGPGIGDNDLSFSRNGNSHDLLITVNDDPADSVLIQGQFTATFTGVFGTAFFDRAQAFRFSDGSSVTWQDIENTLIANAEATPGAAIYGFDGVDNTLDPGLGGPSTGSGRFMSGGNNNDTYVFGLGYGNDTIKGGHDNILSGGNETILFGPGVDPSQVQVIRNADSGDVTLVLSDGSSLTIENQFVNASFLNVRSAKSSRYRHPCRASAVFIYSYTRHSVPQYRDPPEHEDESEGSVTRRDPPPRFHGGRHGGRRRRDRRRQCRRRPCPGSARRGAAAMGVPPGSIFLVGATVTSNPATSSISSVIGRPPCYRSHSSSDREPRRISTIAFNGSTGLIGNGATDANRLFLERTGRCEDSDLWRRVRERRFEAGLVQSRNDFPPVLFRHRSRQSIRLKSDLELSGHVCGQLVFRSRIIATETSGETGLDTWFAINRTGYLLVGFAIPHRVQWRRVFKGATDKTNRCQRNYSMHHRRVLQERIKNDVEIRTRHQSKDQPGQMPVWHPINRAEESQ